ncbi:hypothetical protein PET01_09720 [Pediococcus ethanolidurans]|nr:hypothetical protein PET01_09720 [Pediococcus ethanolidurans]
MNAGWRRDRIPHGTQLIFTWLTCEVVLRLGKNDKGSGDAIAIQPPSKVV